jgi:hypothetical protein
MSLRMTPRMSLCWTTCRAPNGTSGASQLSGVSGHGRPWLALTFWGTEALAASENDGREPTIVPYDLHPETSWPIGVAPQRASALVGTWARVRDNYQA